MTATAPERETSREVRAPRPYATPTERADRRWHRALSLGLVTAVLIHLAVVLLTRTTSLPPPVRISAAGPQALDIRAAESGGSGMEMVELRPESPEREPVPQPVPEPDRVVEIEERPTPTPELGPVVPPTQQGTGGVGSGGDAGQATGPGTTTGEGRGGAGSEGEGDAGIVAPVPRGMILPPPDRPRNVRGMEITVWVFVTDRGRVNPDSTRLDPPTPDARYNDRLRRSAAEWVFEPAKRAGRAIGAWYPFEIIL